MPELPFLTVLAENLDAQIRGRTITDVRVTSASVLKTFDPPITGIRGARVTGVRRRGKVLIIDLAPAIALAPTPRSPQRPAQTIADKPAIALAPTPRSPQRPAQTIADKPPDQAPPLALLVHLMRNGRLQLAQSPAAPPAAAGHLQPAPGRPARPRRVDRDLALVIALEGGLDLRMIEMGSKKAASVWLFRAGEETHGPLAGLGMEPFSPELTGGALARMLGAERMRLKPFLLSQRYLVGIGNAYADEILWEARLSPQALTPGLSGGDAGALRDAIVATLRRAIAAQRAELGGALPMKEPLSSLRVHRHGGEPCVRCGSPIAVIYYEDRETYYCPACQAGGKVYADRRRSRLLR